MLPAFLHSSVQSANHGSFFPPRHIQDIGTFQDAGPLVNDPLIPALSEVATLHPHLDGPDFLLSLGTGEPRLSPNPSPDEPRTRGRQRL